MDGSLVLIRWRAKGDEHLGRMAEYKHSWSTQRNDNYGVFNEVLYYLPLQTRGIENLMF